MAYEQREFIIYSTTKSAFQELLDSGGVSDSQIGIISETSEFWAKGQYYDLVNLSDYMKKGDPIDLATDLSGSVGASEEMFRFRASAGNKPIKDESALIRTIKGRSVVCNQWVYNNTFSNGTSGWAANNSTLTAVTDGVSLRNNTGSNQYISRRIGGDLDISAGHKIFVSIDYKRSASSSSYCSIELLTAGRSAGIYRTSVLSNSRRTTFGVLTATNGGCDEVRFAPFLTGASGTYSYIYSVQVVDLTIMFGAGNEPSAVQFMEMFNNSVLPYQDSYLQGVMITGIKTVGFNCFDKNSAINGYIADNGAVISTTEYKVSDFIRVLPSTQYYALNVCDSAYHPAIAMYDSSMKHIGSILLTNKGSNPPVNVSGAFSTTESTAYIKICMHNSYLGSCCINIRRTGTRDGEYEDYKSFVRELPEIGDLFPRGMMSVGDVYDEINPDYAIRRIGLKDYNPDDLADATNPTDGYQVAYILDVPEIVKFSNPVQLDYDVFDWGTEEALLNSNNRFDMLVADISYQFNAKGRIRDNSRNIERLEESINKMSSAAPYVFKSITANDFVNSGGNVLQIDYDSDDLQGGEISRALEYGRPVYIRAGHEEDWLRGITPMRWIYEEDLIYGSFTNPIDSMEYTIEISGQYVSFIKMPATPEQANWIETDQRNISYIRNKPDTTIPIKRVRVSNLDSVDELIPGYLYEQTSVLATSTVHGLTDDYDDGANFWMVRIPMSRNGSVINFDDAILWANGAPTYSFSGSIGGYGIFEITLKRDLTGHILGEWKFFK